MKTSEIENVIDNFIVSDSRAIMFNGEWGIGKTYTIEKLLKDNRYKKEICDDCNVHYVSLFGFKDTEILHKELYKKFHPYKTRGLKALSYVSLAVSLNKVGVGLDSSRIRQDAEEEQKNKPLSNKKKKNLIIFDDVERVASKEDGFIELFGYFNRLINEGIKILAICNSNELQKENENVFNRFKEKIFDRIYTINESNEEVIKKLFGDKYIFLNKNTIDLFENNLRFVIKSKIFIDDVFDQLSKMKGKDNFNKSLICEACVYIVKEFFTKCYSDAFYKKQKKTIDEDPQKWNLSATLLIEKYGTDDFVVNAIENFMQKEKFNSNIYLIRGLYSYFAYNDDSFFTQEEGPKKLLEESLFCYNDKERKEIIKNILESIYNNFEKIEDKELHYLIREILKNTYEELNDDYCKLADIIVNMDNEKKQEYLLNNFSHDLHMTPCEEQRKFAKILFDKLKEKEKNDLIKFFAEAKENKNNGLRLWYSKLRGRSEPLHKEVCQVLKDNKFFLPDLSNTISSNSWEYCHEICEFIIDIAPSLKQELIAVLDEQVEKNPTIQCVKERVDALIEHKLK